MARTWRALYERRDGDARSARREKSREEDGIRFRNALFEAAREAGTFLPERGQACRVIGSAAVARWGGPRMSLELDQYRYLNGVAFPCWAMRTYWTEDGDAVEPLKTRCLANEISVQEYYYLLRQTPPSYIDSIMYVAVDAATARVNEPLSEEDFTLTFPDGTVFTDYRSGETATYVASSWLVENRLWLMATIAAVLTACGALALRGVLAHRRRH